MITDGQWRFLSFDIPEDYKSARLNLTRTLRRIGYKPVQKSLWVCPFCKADEISLIVSELGVAQYVANFTINKTDIEDHLKRII